MLKNKFYIWTLPLGLIALPLISCGQANPTIWNYQQYIDPDFEKEITNIYGYNNFGDLDELEASLDEKRVLGAITTDYQILKFAREKTIQKIDFKKLWNLEYTNLQELKVQLESLYTPFAFKALDQVFTFEDDSRQEHHLWEYTIPYFTQEKVIAFDVRKGDWKGQDLDDIKTINQIFDDKSYRGILNTLAKHGYQKLIINDYIRDNMMIGSESSKDGFSSLPTAKTYQEHIDMFKDTIENVSGFGQKFNSNQIKFDTDGTQVLMDLIDPKKDWDTAFLYNGDVLDAYYSEDNFPLMLEHNFVRIVKPQNPIYLIDGFIIPTYLDGNYLDKAYQIANQFFFKNGDVKSLDVDLENISQDYPILINFDYINYTLVFQVYNDYILKEDYFDQDAIAENMYSIEYDLNSNLKNHFTQLIDDNLFSSMQQYYILSKI